jgi:cytosine/adenosine deaminase-related metal-dependent hydrolase
MSGTTNSAPFALTGRVVTMNTAGDVLDHGAIYGRDGSIVDVRPAADKPPAGFEHVPRVATRGTLFPGLIELHNHLPYDVLGLWQVPKAYENRDQWSGPSTPDYHRLITGPLAVLGADPALVAAVVRYVEVRCLLAGTTTSQGVTLSSAPGIVKHFRGLVRNVESTGDPDLPPAATHIADVDADDAQRFLARISTGQKMILHLAEGLSTNEVAHNHFAALEFSPGQWAITANLVGIHCVGLTDADFAVMAAHGAGMVWSPLSNLLLYGQTANLGAARAAGVPVALGSDWAPSGSKNLLGELKVAQLAASLAGADDVTDADLVAMATRTPASLLGWDTQLGSLEAGKRADLLVVAATTGNPYTRLVDATEADLRLVMIDGIPRMGSPTLMAHLGVGPGSETIRVKRQARMLNLAQADADPDVEKVTVAEAISRLTQALHDLPNASANPPRARTARPAGRIRLAVNGLVDNNMTPRPHLPLHGQLTGPNLPATRTLTAARTVAAAAGPLPVLTLDPLTAADNPTYYATLQAEPNLPDTIKASLP